MRPFTGTHPSAAVPKPALSVDGRRAGIFRVYGWTGLLMVVAFLLSGAWTLALAVVQLAPSEVANFVMGTAHLDFGDFWTLQKADDGIALVATVLLVLVAIGYFGLVVEMWRLSSGTHRRELRPRRSVEVHPLDEAARPQGRGLSRVPQRALDQRKLIQQWLRVRVESAFRSQDSPALALPKLLLQTSILFKYLREGFPQLTIFLYASLLFLNWLISTYCAMAQLFDPRSVLVRIFYSFDMFFAVFAPLQVIVYAYSNFNFDAATFATFTEVFNPGSFEVIARLFADPGEVSLFRSAFHSLQFSTLWSLLVKIVLNVFTIRKWERTIRLLSKPEVVLTPVVPHQRISRTLAAFFLSLGLGVFVYSIVVVVSSTIACKPFEQCKVPSYRWNVGALDCSCSVFVERHTVVRTFAEWEDPIDTSVNLGRLAASGDLRVVQIVNRQLPTLPDELRRCTGLEQLILVYTKTVMIPEWANEFTNLEYFHMEGDNTAKQIQSLPRDMFTNTPKLGFLHLGGLGSIPFVPDLNRVPQLKYLTLALLSSVTEFPSFDKLPKLGRLNIVNAIEVEVLPSFHALTKLTSFSLVGQNAVCCNGFLTGECDLSSACRDPADTRPANCSPLRMSPRDRALVDTVGRPVCKDSQRIDLAAWGFSRELSDGVCGGVLYKRCEFEGLRGICVPSRWVVVVCERFSPYEAARRLQIQRGVGDPCDPVVEAWLGCGGSGH